MVMNTASNDNSLLLTGQQLTFRVEEGITLIRDVTVDINEGELIGLIGPNGAGKSTLLRVLSGIETPSDGCVSMTVSGSLKLVSALAVRERAQKLSYLVQGAKAHWPIEVEQMIALGRLPFQKWWQPASDQDQEKVIRAMRLTETLSYRKRLVTSLSGGEQALVMMARVLAGEPEIIFADEPVSTLDPYHQLHVMELLREHAREAKSAVVVLHDLSLAARFCDRIYLMNEGELFREGRPERVLNQQNMACVYGVDSRISFVGQRLSISPVARLRDHQQGR
jgi:iron complex transport system ATP-binding protein